MGIGIQICGLNGSGKSTLGRALAEKIGFYFIDDENLYFSRSNPNEPYTNPKPRHEVEQLLMNEVKNHPDFVFAAVKGDYEKDIISMYDYVIMIEVPKSVRSQRVRNRSFKKFGSRMLLGGDLYNQEEAFFQMVESRQGNYVENWLQTVKCPIIRVDGTKPIDENVEYIINSISIQISICQTESKNNNLGCYRIDNKKAKATTENEYSRPLPEWKSSKSILIKCVGCMSDKKNIRGAFYV